VDETRGPVVVTVQAIVTPGVTVTREDPGTEAAARLIDELSEALESITGASGRASSDPASLRGEGACFVLARDGTGTPVGCGGFRAFDDAPQVVEIKRMYARAGTRGVGAAVLAALEREAIAQGAREAWLETRRVNARAVGFYERQGYVVIPNYGRYAGREDAVCLGKSLPAAGASSGRTSSSDGARG